MTHQLFLGEPSSVAAAAEGASLLLDGDEGRHAAAVVRLRVGERYFVADGAGRRLLLEATDVDRASVRGTVLQVADDPAPSPRFVLVQALAKGDRDEQAIEAATELGVDEVVPWQAERSVVVWRGERAAKSLAKWAAVVTRATKQSRRARMPVTSPAVGLTPLVARVGESALTLVLHEDATEPLASVELPHDGDVLLVVGPEGGISQREVEALQSAGARPVRLGSTILRASS
ncbi:MAG: 16S rRNA (uracil(1498)-N(3))-methyltransferase, partial [Dermatophilaceae bacterium]|nr:16S rRNA (uracil(1498)-N(3))-methyltransferase [Dermatophilaceae bacterium]